MKVRDDLLRTNKAAANGTLLSAKTPSEAAALVAVFFPDKSKE